MYYLNDFCLNFVPDINGASRVLSTKNECENDVTTVTNSETVKEREIRMDIDVFRQVRI